jgi:2-polyprenyl-3-methyl-5-hydroxy-6-metoxy-1,4-benzoquinol methylase
VLTAQALAYHTEPGETPLSLEKQAVLARVPAGARVLEVGAHTGFFSAALRDRGCRVTALEADPRAARHATLHADRVIVGDVEQADVRARVEGPFDVVLFMHVLEHLVDPWSVLRAMRKRVAPGGKVIVLLPNVACWRIRKALFFGGAFEYEDTGILDRTHVRFFTYDSGAALLTASGWSITERAGVDVCVPLERRLSQLPVLRRLAPRWHRWLAHRHPNLCTEIALFTAIPAREDAWPESS